MDKNSERLIIVFSIDNPLKGVAGEAIQNMNIMFDLVEQTGLDKL